MAAPAVGTGTLRRLGELDSDGDPVLSVYLDLDWTRCPGAAAHEGELDALIAGVDPQAAQTDVSRVRQILRCMPGFAYGTRGIAVFSSAGGSAHEAVPLPSPATPMAVVDTIPWLEPLAAMFTAGDWGAAVLGRHTGRLFRGGARALVEFAAFDCERQCAPANGGSRRTHWRHGIEQRSAEDARQLAGRLLRAHRRRAFEHLVVIASSELLPVIEADLHGDLRERLAGLVTEPHLERAPAREILRVVAPLLERAQRDGTTRIRHAYGGALPAAASAVAPRRTATRFLQQLQRARRTGRSDGQPTRSTRWRAPRSGQKEETATGTAPVLGAGSRPATDHPRPSWRRSA
ncbi:MAG: hypothetical protein ACHQAV_05815 [Solirubrobacterales bacterium]